MVVTRDGAVQRLVSGGRFGGTRSGTRGAPIYLDTLEARAVPFHESCGCRIIERRDLLESDVHVWAMRTP